MSMSKQSVNHYKIKEEPNEFDDHLLDIIGNTFKFDHVKGLAEWLKNSVDAYRRANLPEEEQHIIFRFQDSPGGNASMECIDFVGMTSEDIEKALKRWGDPEASKRGLRLKTYGGHGNGGKFYMREMFKESYFVTYRSGKLNIFGFSPNRKYGFADGFKDVEMSIDEALRIAGLDTVVIPPYIRQLVNKDETGFTVVRGIGPAEMPNMIKTIQLCNRIKNHPQARRLLHRIPVQVFHNRSLYAANLQPDPIPPMKGFETLEPIEVPEKITFNLSARKVDAVLANADYPNGTLKLFTSELALERGSKLEELNRIDVIGELGVIASYYLHELPNVGFFPQTVFIYGECECPILEDPNSDCVQNDRTKLVDNDQTKALLGWIGERVRELSERMAEREKQQQQNIQRDLSNLYNDFLNNWKNKFMSRVFSKILVGPGQGSGGGTGDGGSLGPIGNGKANGGRSGGGEGDNEGGGNKEKKGHKYPRVLISEVDPDPLSADGKSIILDPRQGLIYQRPQDDDEGIYWINYSAPLAKGIRDKYGENSLRWRDYLLQRYVDILVKEALLKLERQDPEAFTLRSVEQTISKVATEAQEAALKELSSFLFEEQFDSKR